MNCMKCGREAEVNQIFCPECLAEMEKYPVKPGTVVQLPAQPNVENGKKAHHRRPILSPEEQIKRMHKKMHRLILALILTTSMTIFLGLLTYEILIHSGTDKLLGQNYSTVDNTATSGSDPRAPIGFGFAD